MAACLVLRRAGSVRRAVVLAGILLAGFCSPGMVVISRVLIVLRRESARDWVRSGREFLRLMVRAGAVVDIIWVVSADIGEGLGQVMGLSEDLSRAVVAGTRSRSCSVRATSWS